MGRIRVNRVKPILHRLKIVTTFRPVFEHCMPAKQKYPHQTPGDKSSWVPDQFYKKFNIEGDRCNICIAYGKQ